MNEEYDRLPPKDDIREAAEEEIRTRKYLRHRVEEMLDYINWAAAFPNQQEVVESLERILNLIREGEDAK